MRPAIGATMPKYMINIMHRDSEAMRRAPVPEDMMERFRRWSDSLASRTIASHKLKNGEGRVLRNDGRSVTDGAYVETKESIGGFYVVEAKNYDEAVALARGCPWLTVEGGHVEVRAVEF
jgi:hypothetical protein